MKQAIAIIGGYNSFWPSYLKMARELEAISGLPAVAVPLTPWHWWQAERAKSAANILQKLEGTLAWSQRQHGADRIILTGHSAGGLIARLFLCGQPVWGQVYQGGERVSRVITLGSPHCEDAGDSAGWFLIDTANRLAPGTAGGDGIDYCAVAGRSIQGSANGDWRERRAYRSYHFFIGRGEAWGDGAVPVDAAALTGAENLVLEGVDHSRKYGPNWYGATREVIRRWWPER
jgi:pimeloyl-ACP methyl ester carboxylesterase